MTKKTNGFEAKLTRLEQIVEKLESGETGLEESLKMFEEGTTLSNELSAKLEEVRLKIEKLTRTPQGAIKTEPFEPETDEQQ
ncbi:MAG: exodeoxyribonuclease VII small subunit [Elusimicrobiales bacterium]